jgi:hypothetical protein
LEIANVSNVDGQSGVSHFAGIDQRHGFSAQFFHTFGFVSPKLPQLQLVATPLLNAPNLLLASNRHESEKFTNEVRQ